MNNRTILLGNCAEKLKDIPDDTIGLIATDPPYGYAFMNKDWDKAVIPVSTWKECLRVLKPGAFAYVMSAPRQDVLSHMIVNLSNAGFNTNFTSLYWAYGTGFPKAMNISKAVDKKLGEKREVVSERRVIRNSPSWDSDNGMLGKGVQNFDITKPASFQAKKLDGSYAGYQPKPALEVILVTMKPLQEKNYVQQAMKNNKGVTWFDDCRIPHSETIEPAISAGSEGLGKTMKGHIYTPNNQGRFPANLLVSDDSLDMGKITPPTWRPNCLGKDYDGVNNGQKSVYGDFNKRKLKLNYDDKGDFSRYFSLDAWEAQFIITPKPSKSEKNKGLSKYMENIDEYGGKFPCSKLAGHKVNDGRKTDIDNPYQRGDTVRQNTHPTVKPVSLFKYLITMGSRPNDIILDPFMGSGTTAVAAELTARNWIGIEQNPEYEKIIRKRIATLTNNRLDNYT